ncbi:secondary thiamine-phosphate synthase enzyme [Aureimonas sp. Leaf454]|uniref:secondary thiamine-phosphate synthase enzyme YjbQ n=1 Tax=Aureimonas sp. Leaf454 TaxID=1736381 RepID=UPI0006F209D5|nr:secondary thiamine-phosphate synthase enzyme YjbQ [Aureimonas sp. Leaf454]KQT54500.1 secondary thiamine-phosphate synthase enzyme [Aureimonas sp. Leaf454]
MQFIETLAIRTKGRSMLDISAAVAERLKTFEAADGLLTAFIRHTSASLVIQENADPDVQADFLDALDRLAPAGPIYRHSIEGPDDMPAHIKAAVTSTSLSIPVLRGQLMLGTWQGLFVVEHRARPHTREVVLHYSGTRTGPPGASVAPTPAPVRR